MRGLLADILSSEADVTVVDMEAGLEHLSRSGGTLRHVDQLLVVVEPYAKAVETARRTVLLARELGIPSVSAVASKVRDELERELVERLCNQENFALAAVIPCDDEVRLADREGLPPIEAAPKGRMVRAVEILADSLGQQQGLVASR